MMLNLMKILSILVCLCSLSWGAEEEIEIDHVTNLETASNAPSPREKPKFHLMGRLDLTYQSTAVDQGKEKTHHLDNQHFLVFLKLQASPKTSFFGEIVDKSFYFADFEYQEKFHFQFGKILVPFGDTKRSHRIYGGVSQLKSSGVMLPNIWAESGFNFHWKYRDHRQFDFYVVDSIQDSSSTEDPDLKSAPEPREIQAAGLRATEGGDWGQILVSVYRGEYQAGKEIWLAGIDFNSAENVLNVKGASVAFGVANAWLKKAPISGDFQKRGDYFEISHTGTFAPEHLLRLRYGTYIDNDQTRSQKDTHSFSLGYALPIDVMRLLLEYQWNFEAKDEQNNDIAKAMLSVDF